MPLFDYVCPDCNTRDEELVSLPIPETLPCSCGGTRERRFGRPAVHLSWARPAMTEAKDIWEGFPGLEGTDGINQAQYKSTKAFINT